MTLQNKFWQQSYSVLTRPARYGWSKNLARNEEGQSLVETSLSILILMGFVFSLAQICLAFYTYEYISEMAREGARYAAMHGPTCQTSAGASCTIAAADIKTYVAGIGLPNLGGGTMVVTPSYPNGELVGQPVVVNITYSFPYHVPWMPYKALSMSSTSEVYIIQ
jgi:Flp pilus assembly protein TadG